MDKLFKLLKLKKVVGIKKFSQLLPALAMFVTQHPRYLPPIEWSKNSWVHNIFRVYELLFWRRDGIRHEMTCNAAQQLNGKVITTYEVYTFEAACALIEQFVRQLLKFKFKLPVKVFVPKLSFSGGAISPSPFMFAIALDTVSNQGTGAGSATFSFSYTCTGSNRILLSSLDFANTNSVSSATYNSVGMTQYGTANGPDAGNAMIVSYLLVAPASGANTLQWNLGNTNGNRVSGTASYTGAKQTGQPDAAANGTGTGGSSVTHFTQALSSTVANCYFVHMDRGGSGFTLTGDSGTTVQQQPEGTFLGGGMIWDSGGPIVASGSYTLGVTCTAQIFNGGQQISIAPAAAAATPSGSNLQLMGVG